LSEGTRRKNHESRECKREKLAHRDLRSGNGKLPLGILAPLRG
jgi:hypothetical protein